MLSHARHQIGIRRPGSRTRGQSVVEFALVLPVVLLILMMGLDFGRVYLGWVNLNNTARIASNYAATNATRFAAGSGPVYDAAFDGYYNLVQQDAGKINCSIPPKAAFPPPSYPGGTGLGAPAHVAITCQFGLITPIISRILGSPISVSASSDFPIRTGVIAGVPGGPPGVVDAEFTFSPGSGVAPRHIVFTDASTGGPTTWAWDFNNDNVIDSTSQTGNFYDYTIADVYHVKLTVSNGTSTSSVTHDITITNPPGPVPIFTALPGTGTAPQTVTFTNNSTGSGPLTYVWDFGDSSPTSTATTPPPKSYAAGSWTIRLTVTDAFAQSNFAERTVSFSAVVPQCTVPNFKNITTDDTVPNIWTSAGFDTPLIFSPARPPEYKITKQSLAAGSQQPCSGTPMTVFDH
jgi:PKD repeat protein